MYMPEFKKNHYIQNRLLKNFAVQSENGKYKICLIDLFHFTAEYHNTDSTFYKKNFYDIKENINQKELEIKFGDIVEQPMCAIFNKLQNSKNTITLTRSELEIIKKYILLQLYRTPHNKTSYTNIPKDAFELSQFNIGKDESKEDFWKREMLTILDSDWDTLLTTEMVGIRKHAIEINTSFLMFVSTNAEFCINDLGYCTERIPVIIPKEKENEYINAAKKLGQELYGQDNFDEIAKKEIRNKRSYVDNYVLFPISSNMAILSVSLMWKMLYLHPTLISSGIPYQSPILSKHLSLPLPQYVNESKIISEQDIPTYKHPDDKYTYIIHNLSKTEAIYLNHLTINEAFCYVGLKTPSQFIDTIKQYNILASNNTANIHHNLLGFVELLTKLN